MWYRSISLTIVLALVCLAGCAAEDDAATTPTTEPTTTTTEAADPLTVATELADAFTAAWSGEKDPEAVAGLFTDDGVYVHTDQQRYEGPASIERAVQTSPQPIDPERVTDVMLGEDGRYVLRIKFGWSGRTYVEEVHLELDGDRAAYVGWAGWPERYAGTYGHLFEAEYSGTMEVTSDDFCEEGWVPLEGTVTGTEAELGPFEATARHCSDPETGRIAEGSAVIVMADGDELYASYEGRMVAEGEDGSLTMKMVQTYEGGTGRFAGAEGVADESCTARYVSETQAEVSGSLKGTLSYGDEQS